MLFFNKALPVFFLPFGIVCFFAILAIWRRKVWPGVLALAVFYLASIPLVAERFEAWLESAYAPGIVEQAGPADAVVVLGGILGPAHRPGRIPNWGETVERFEAGVALTKAGRVETLVFTGAARYWLESATLEGDELKRLAIERGVPAEKIIVTRWIDNTATEAAAVADLARERGWKKVLLVTSAGHMRRSVFLFQRAGVPFEPFTVDFRADGQRPIAPRDFVPTSDAWQATEKALRECYGYWFYRLFR